MAPSLVIYLLGLLTIPFLRLLLSRFLDRLTRSKVEGEGFYSDRRDTFALNVLAPQHAWFNMGYWVGGWVQTLCVWFELRLREADLAIICLHRPQQTFGEACEALCRLVVEEAVKDRKGFHTTRVFEAGMGSGDSTLVWERSFDGLEYTGVTLEEAQYKRACQRTAELKKARVVHGDAVKVLRDCEEGAFDVVVAVDCAYHFRSRDDFLRSSYQALSPHGYLCMTDLLLTSRILVMRDRFLLRLLCKAASLPFSNLQTPSRYRANLLHQGYKEIELIDISDDVWPGWLNFMDRHDQSLGFGLHGSTWSGLKIYAKFVKWYSGGGKKGKGKLGFYLIRARNLKLAMLRVTLPRSFHSSRYNLGTLGIRAEDAKRIWERRSALTPTHVQRLIRDGKHKVLVMPSEKRCFTDQEYQDAGAIISDDLLPHCDVIVGIKEIPIPHLLPSPSKTPREQPTYLFFSHTHKGQSYNMPLLSTMLQSGARYLDWELLTAPKGPSGKLERTTAFGRFAGFAAMCDGLSSLGTKLLASRGVDTSLIRLVRPNSSRGVEELKQQLVRAGKEWNGPKTGVVTIAVAGKGRVGNGAREVLDAFGVEWVDLKGLKSAVENPNSDKNKIYAVHLELSDYLKHKDGKNFDREEYRSQPDNYVSRFDTEVAPYTTLFFNGAYWAPGCPRILSTSQLAKIQKDGSPERMLAIVDAACDFDGALEFVKAATTIDDPVIQYDANSDFISREPSQKGATQISAVEIYPAALPRDASEHFSESILPYVEALLEEPKTSRVKNGNEIVESLKRATLVEGGQLTPGHEHLYEALKGAQSVGVKRRKVVVLGSGLVAGPAIRTLASRKALDVVVASNDLPAAEALAAPYENAKAVALDATRDGVLEELVTSADVVLSLLPAPLHVGIAELCIKGSTSLVTASYVSPEMAALQSKAASAGITILPELGLDPGIDHASGCQLIEEARESGNKITSFVSFCGGLPGPELSNGPLGYKFSWSPRGVLTAALNSATFRLNGKDRTIPGADLLRSNFPRVPILPGFSLEGVANRDSVSYLEQYGLPKDLPTILRGTLRYPGFSRLVDGFKRLGLLSLDKLETVPVRWSGLLDAVLAESGHRAIKTRDERIDAMTKALGADEKLAKDCLATLEELGLAPTDAQTVTAAQTLPTIPNELTAPLDLLSILLGHQLAYRPDERDAVLLHHELCTRDEKTGEVELFSSTLVQYGTSEASAMATTVGVPIAIGALLILDEQLTKTGIVTPSDPQVWKPLLKELDKVGVRMVETRRKGVGRGVLEELA
ncbi:BZ3500_MvSof-1268-A1-R1_Chr12-3g04003 [Microbotryum saponariae]|uniref:BZ3500_MvSof-1268-A1-R1_Chr12-3g04003 protein n=1 Tax=Microbotryum saponariae TaxID=289078 RepID=A0A2X0KLL3_9BASI|nr:BZ3500_MvSof-1268-A1-R1_Chr12-3g04003 [Microbotryum saponariae]SDA02516.1 BZ3501_MvSof-1269-A2-R1_Chr12-3g03658 [Microbotryum saponariae]